MGRSGVIKGKKKGNIKRKKKGKRKGKKRGRKPGARPLVLPRSPTEDYETFDRLFQIVVTSENPPHQMLATLLHDLLDWTPAEIVADSSRTLVDLERHVERELAQVWARYGLGARYVSSRFEPLCGRLASLRSARLLEDYYKSADPGGRATEVSHWCESILRHAWKSFTMLNVIQLTGANALPHCALAFAHVRGLGWQPQRVRKHCSPSSLTMLTQQVEDALLKERKLAPWLVQGALAPLRKRLGYRVEVLVWEERAKPPLNPDPGDVPPALYPQVSGDTHLYEYFTWDNRDRQVERWSKAAAERSSLS